MIALPVKGAMTLWVLTPMFRALTQSCTLRLASVSVSLKPA